MNIKKYFDLNERTSQPKELLYKVGYQTKEIPPPTVNVIQMPFSEQILLYIGTVIGVIFSSVIMEFKSGNAVSLAGFNITTLLISAVIALFIIPVVYEKLKVMPDTPILVRFGLFVQQGVFWQVAFSAIGAA